MAAVAVRWQVSEDARFTRIVQSGEAVARPELAHSVHVEVAGLKPRRPYWYRFLADGADAAAMKNFGVGADRLTPAQAARLAAILPSPLKWKAAKPGPYVKRRSGKINAAAGTVRRQGMADCVLS